MPATDIPLPPGVGDYRFQDLQRLALALSEQVAAALQAAIAARGQGTLVVSGGRSPVAFFQRLSQFELPWSKVLIGLVDERWVAADHPDSNEGLVRRHLLQSHAASANFLGLFHPAETPEASAILAERALQGFPWPIDVLVLGMGDDGHTASLFPDTPNLDACLSSDCPRACLATRAPQEPRDRLTLTLPPLSQARRRFLQVQGVGKRQVLERAAAGESLPIGRFLCPPLEVYWCP